MLSLRRVPATASLVGAALFYGLACLGGAGGPAPARLRQARSIAARSGLHGGLVVDLGCGAGELAEALHLGPAWLVQGLAFEPSAIHSARERLLARGLLGPVTVAPLAGPRLPYIDNLVDLLVVEKPGHIPEPERFRVLRPGGVLVIRNPDGTWRKQVKPRPPTIDRWTHYLHDPGNNAVAHDSLVAPPRHLQWTADPPWSRHHDHVSSTTAMVCDGPRVFQVLDKGSIASILLPSHWALVCRDAFNGKLLWEHPIPEWETRMWPLKSGPAQLPRRLVADGGRVYIPLGLDVPVSALDAASGNVLKTYPDTRGAEEILCSHGVLFVLTDPHFDLDKYTNPRAVHRPWWTGRTHRIVAVAADSGKPLWQVASPVMPLTLAADDARVYFHDGNRLVALDRQTGKRLWQSAPVPRCRRIMSFFAPTLVVRDGVVLFAGGEQSGLVKSTGGATKSDTITAVDAASGKILWHAPHPPSGYSSPEDVFVIGNTVWFESVSNGKLPGTVIGRDLHTGKLIRKFDADVHTYWFHHRCYRGRATDRFIMTSRTGIEFIDPQKKHWDVNDWIRGGCMYGIMPCNGLIYTPPHPCICYAESKLTGFDATAPARATDPAVYAPAGNRLERSAAPPPAAPRAAEQPADPGRDWPTFRHDAGRSGATPTRVAPNLKPAWTTPLHGRLTAPTLAGGTLYVAEIDSGVLFALDALTGRIRWHFIAGGRIDSPPTVTAGRVLFGCRDGWLYCLRAGDGALLWRFRAAPNAARLVASEQLESVWPLHGSVLVMNGIVWAVAGRSMFLDGGLRWVKLDARTGKKLQEIILDNRDPNTGKNLQSDVKWLNMPVALPDVLSSDGAYIYMRSQRFDLNGKRYELAPISDKPGVVAADQSGPGKHLFCPTGFLDGSWFHRSYWEFGKKFSSGWCGYYLAGKIVPAGRILCVAGHVVYGYGRKPRYYRWTTPIQYQLFAAPLGPAAARQPAPPAVSCVRIDNSRSLNCTRKPLTVMAWIKPEKANGVILARGANVNGYSLYLRGGKPRFAVTAAHRAYEAAARRPIKLHHWVHLAGRLAPDGTLQVWVNGRIVGEKHRVPLIPRVPIEPTQVGLDDGGPAGKYRSIPGLAGAIDEVRIYHRALAPAEILAQAEHPAPAAPQSPGLVLYLPFDRRPARDASGSGNRVTVENAKPVPGKLGNALEFTGTSPAAARTRGYKVRHQWTADIPVLVRAMVLTGAGSAPAPTLFVAGPPQLADEPSLSRRLANPKTQKLLAAQEAAFAGRRGGRLVAFNGRTGAKLAEFPLDSPPVWDGMIAAGGRLYLCTLDHRVRCLVPRR